MILRHCFRQGEVQQDRIRESEAAREKKRHVDSPATQHAANRRPKHKTQTERGAD